MKYKVTIVIDATRDDLLTNSDELEQIRIAIQDALDSYAFHAESLEVERIS